MTETEKQPYINIRMDPNNLYREETFTDGKVGAIRRMLPVKLDGTDDESRDILFMGNTQLISPSGQPVPIQCAIEAKTLGEAIDKFPDAVNQTVSQIMAEAKQRQEKEGEGSAIIQPG
jgi:hypothetical protein